MNEENQEQKVVAHLTQNQQEHKEVKSPMLIKQEDSPNIGKSTMTEENLEQKDPTLIYQEPCTNFADTAATSTSVFIKIEPEDAEKERPAFITLDYRGDDEAGDKDDETEDSSSSSSDSDESSSSSSSEDEKCEAAEKRKPVAASSEEESDGEQGSRRANKQQKTNSMRTKGELCVEDLPPIERLQITVDESVELIEIGSISAVIGVLVIVQGKTGLPALNLESVLFREGRKSLGTVFETFGPVVTPLYSVRFNSPEDITENGLQVGDSVYYAPQKEEYTKFVFVTQLIKTKGSDASWENNNEPPAKYLDYSDDEQERKAKAKMRRGGRGENESEEEGEQDSSNVKKRKNGNNKRRENHHQHNNRGGGTKSRGRGNANKIQSWPPKRSDFNDQCFNQNFHPPPPPKGSVPPPKCYVPPPEGYVPPPEGYVPPSRYPQRGRGGFRMYQPKPFGYQPTDNRFIARHEAPPHPPAPAYCDNRQYTASNYYNPLSAQPSYPQHHQAPSGGFPGVNQARPPPPPPPRWGFRAPPPHPPRPWF